VRLEEYIAKKNNPELKTPRESCLRCLRPSFACHCNFLLPFDPKIHFVILIHWREAQKKIATGRISHLSLKNSQLLNGYNYSEDHRISALLENPLYHPVVLYPGEGSLNVSSQTPEQRNSFVPCQKKLLVFVIDGTWTTARKTMQRSKNLRGLPSICFDPPSPSRFRVRKQPGEHCYSTIEAIHQTIELLGPSCGFDVKTREHDGLLQLFERMIDQQVEFSLSRRRSHREEFRR